jgi:sugar transferase (PEP-CTERM/EpsH1 system associated)
MTVYRLIRYFAQRHEVYLACFYNSDAELSYVPELNKLCKEVQCVKLKHWQAALNMVYALPNSGMPLQVAYYRDKRMRNVVDDMLKRCKPDLAYAHLIRMGEYIKGKSAIPRVLAMQISQTLNYRRMIANVRSVFYKMLYHVEYDRVRKYEPAITRSFDSCLLISKHDKRSLEGHHQLHNIFYSPHGVDIEFYTRSIPVAKEKAILFCGVLETPTNIDAALYFYRDIYPLVKKRVSDVRLYLVGKNPPTSIRKLAETDASVVVTGFVKDVRPYYSKAKVGIDPLRIGAGLQNKLLIGMSMGQPMVCSSIANEGISAEHGKHLFIADEPQAFASAVVELLENDEIAERIVHNARKFVEEKWTWEYYFRLLECHLEDLAS